MDLQDPANQQVAPKNAVAKGLGRLGTSVSSAISGVFARKKPGKTVPLGAVEMMDFSQMPTHRKSDSNMSNSTVTSSIPADEQYPL